MLVFFAESCMGWMENKESIYSEKIFYSHVITSFLFFVLKTKANSSQSMNWCLLKTSLLLSRIVSSDVMLENRVYLTSTVSMSRSNHSNVTSIHQTQTYQIYRSVVSVVDEESRRTSIASFSMQMLTISGPTLIKLSLYSFRKIL